MYRTIVMIEEVVFILQFANGIYIINHNVDIVYLQLLKQEKYYNYSYICTNNFNFSKMVLDAMFTLSL